MYNNENFITKSLALHLFFMRIMKEHMFFIEVAFTPQNFGFQNAAAKLKEQANNFLAKVVSIANGNVSQQTLNAEEIVTKYTLDVEKMTAYFTNSPIDTKITTAEYALTPNPDRYNMIDPNEIVKLNNEAQAIVSSIIDYKTQLLEQITKCSIFTLNYPLLINHILREAKHYLKKIMQLNNPNQMRDPNELVKEEVFWNKIMAEHSKFIRGLLDPSEEELMKMANMFANKFDQLTLDAKKAEQNYFDLSNITYQSLQEAEKIKNFKAQGTEGILNCKIKSIIIPLLADHTLREANHYIKLLKSN